MQKHHFKPLWMKFILPFPFSATSYTSLPLPPILDTTINATLVLLRKDQKTNSRHKGCWLEGSDWACAQGLQQHYVRTFFETPCSVNLSIDKGHNIRVERAQLKRSGNWIFSPLKLCIDWSRWCSYSCHFWTHWSHWFWTSWLQELQMSY